jgi:hypothetical protein
MELSRAELADGLEELLRSGPSPKELSTWAHGLYLDHSPLGVGVYEVLMELVAMEEGDQFTLDDSQLAELVGRLRGPGS